MSIVENMEKIVNVMNDIRTTEAVAKIFLHSAGVVSSKSIKAAEYISSGEWQEDPARLMSYNALYKKFLNKLPDDARLSDEQSIKALEWFYERLCGKWKLEG